MESKKIGTIVRYEGVLMLADSDHELPVFRTAETKIVDMVGNMTCRMGDFNQGRVQAFIDQKLHCRPVMALPYRVARIGFRFAQGRTAGRPRRGKAWI